MGRLVEDLNKIVKDNKLICSNIQCRSNNIKLNSNPNKVSGIESGIYEFKCEECGEVFAFITTHGSDEDNIIKELI